MTFLIAMVSLPGIHFLGYAHRPVVAIGQSITFFTVFIRKNDG
jgi:hypothetical protein